MNLFCGNNLDILKELPENSVDSIVTDPPYGLVSIVKRFKNTDLNGSTKVELDSKNGTTPYGRTSRGFMGHEWDGSGIEYSEEFWSLCFRVLKPGGHLISFSGTRTYHKVVTAIENCGFEIRDMLSWIYGQGFPKSLNISKQMDAQILCGNGGTRKLREVEQEFGGEEYTLTGKNNGILGETRIYDRKVLDPQTEQAKNWEGWGTALKPAVEPIVLARKPISEKNIALNIIKWGTGGINIDATRIELNGEIVPINKLESWSGFGQEVRPDYEETVNTKGRWPSNLLLDEESAELLDQQAPESKTGKTSFKERKRSGFMLSGSENNVTVANSPDTYGDAGGVSRFFYCAKPSSKERESGLGESFQIKTVHSALNTKNGAGDRLDGGKSPERRNFHPTVKPIKLMEYLVKLVTPDGGICLDPFMGSGTTGIACKNLGKDFIGIELNEEYFRIAEARINGS